ncbi:nucleolar protein 8 [Dissophora globulifera]|nr:nucleolar protein 8 [Dissophora globulifera]
MKAFNSKDPHRKSASESSAATGGSKPDSTFHKPAGRGGRGGGLGGRGGGSGSGRGGAFVSGSRPAYPHGSQSKEGSFGRKPQQHQQQRQTPTSTSAPPPASTASDMFSADDDQSATATTTKPAKVKKPKEPKPPLDPNEHITQRAFIGGLAQDLTPTDLEGRFKSFGQLKDVYLARDVDGSCRGFGYVTLDTTRKEWLKCLALYNGAKWKGNVMKIEEANKDWQTKRQEDLEAQVKLEKKEQSALLKKAKRNPVKYAEDMSLINDKNMDGKRGWKRGRFGRPVITMKLDRMTYDPSHYKNNVEKLFSTPGRPLPLDKLVYYIDESEPKPKGKHLSTEEALAPFLNRSIPTSAAATTSPSSAPSIAASSSKHQDAARKSTGSATEDSHQDHHANADTSDDHSMMASILAGIDLSPRALSLDGSDLEDMEDGYGGDLYNEDFGVLHDTKADDLFGDVQMHDPETVQRKPKAERDSRPEDLFGEDDDAEEGRSLANRPSLDFLEDEDEDEGEYEEDDEEEEYEEDGEEEEEEEDGGDDDDLDEETIEAIAKLQGTSSTNGGGLFDSDDDDSQGQDTSNTATAKLMAEESNATRLKAMEAREVELEAARERQQQAIASTLANIDSREKKTGHVVFSDSDDYDSEDYDRLEAEHEEKLAKANRPAKSIFDSDSGSEGESEQVAAKSKKRQGTKEMFASDEEDEDDAARFGKDGEPTLNIKEQFEGPGGKALFRMQTKIGTSDSRFQLTKDFLDERIQAEDDVDFIAHQDRLRGDAMAASTDSSGAVAGIVLDEDRQTEANVSAEKMQALNVLRAMFGDDAVRSKKKEEDTARQAKGGLGYTTGLAARYDPDAVPPPPPLVPAPAQKNSIESESESDSGSEDNSSDQEEENKDDDEEVSDQDRDAMEGLEEEENDQEPKDATPVKKSVGFSFAFDADTLNNSDDDGSSSIAVTKKSTTSTTTPVAKNIDNTLQFQVASDLKSLFAPSTSTFKLFGGDDDDIEGEDQDANVEDDRHMDDDERLQEEILTSYTDGSRTIFASGAEALSGRAPLSHSGSMFFFHFKNPALLKRSNFKTNNKVFMRTGTMDEVTAHWEKTRHAMTQEFKRKHKSASRNKARASKRFKSGDRGHGDH